MSEPLRVVLLGPSNIGKAKVARRLAKEFEIKHVFVTRELLEAAAAADNGMARATSEVVKATIENGGLVGDGIVFDIIQGEFLDTRPRSWIISGAPATSRQARQLRDTSFIGGVNTCFLSLETTNGDLQDHICKKYPKKGQDIFERQMHLQLRHKAQIRKVIEGHPNWQLKEVSVGPSYAEEDLVRQVLLALDVDSLTTIT